MNYILSTETVADVHKEDLEGRNISYIPFHYVLNDVEYKDDFGETLSLHDFYESMVQGASTHTSQIPNGEYEAYFRSFLEQGLDVLHVCLSSGLSGSYQGATMMAQQLNEEFKDHKVLVLDSLNASSAVGMLVSRMADQRDQGVNLEELYEYGLKERFRIHTWLFTTDLTYLIRGGRISKASGAIGNMLHIVPLMAFNQSGKIVVRKKQRGKKKAMQSSIDFLARYIEDTTSIYVNHSDCLEDAKAFGQMIQESYPETELRYYEIGTTIGSHTGPETIAFYFVGKDRREVDMDFDN